MCGEGIIDKLQDMGSGTPWTIHSWNGEPPPLYKSAIKVIMEYLVKISKKARILELKRRHLKITVLASYMPARYKFTYPERRLTMKEMLYKFIDEGNREHEEMSAFIRELRTTNELLFKERNNSLITTRGGKTTTQGILNDNTDIHDEGPSVLIHDKPDAPKCPSGD
ncbi:hypothetical protein Tco_0512584 [Tanacetum coccineum]